MNDSTMEQLLRAVCTTFMNTEFKINFMSNLYRIGCMNMLVLEEVYKDEHPRNPKEETSKLTATFDCNIQFNDCNMCH